MPRPRSGSDPRSSGEGRQRTPRPSFRPNTDGEALALREKGLSYAAVARHLELRRATDARAAFIRALHGRPDDERRSIVGREHIRLDELEARIRHRDATEPAKLERRLLALANLREGLD